MEKHKIDLSLFIGRGSVVTHIEDEMLYMTTARRLSTVFDKEGIPLNHYTYLPGTYKLPLRVDLTVKIDSPGLYLFLGKGHVSFGTPWSDNRRIEDILEPSLKTRFYHNHIPMNEFVSISVIYGLKAMQILINGEERFYSEKERYMKSKLFTDINNKGFDFKIACTKRTDLVIKELNITENYDVNEIIHSNAELPKPVITNEAAAPEQKPTFDSCISKLPNDIQVEIINMDSFLRSLKPMKFKRQLEKHGNKITYVAADYGFSYAIYPSNDVMYHSLSWYIITNGKAEVWHRKADMMEETLKRLAETSPELADRMFMNLKECIGCCQRCIVKTPYEFKGDKKITCHGIMEFKMCISDFEDVKAFIIAANKLAV